MGPGDPLSVDRGQDPRGVGWGTDRSAGRPTHKGGTARALSQGRAPLYGIFLMVLGLGIGSGLRCFRKILNSVILDARFPTIGIRA